MIYRVVFEIEVEAESPLEAAKTVEDWLQDPNDHWQYYVQPCDKSEDVFSVDLEEEDENAVVVANEYVPIIE